MRQLILKQNQFCVDCLLIAAAIILIAMWMVGIAVAL